MSIKKPYESWHRADISLHSRPLKPHSWAGWLPDSPHFTLRLFFLTLSLSLTYLCSFFFASSHLSQNSLSVSLSPSSVFLCSLVVSFVISQYFSAIPPSTRPDLHSSLQDLEEELELGRRRVAEAEGAAKRAEEELAVAKERLLLQEDELQSRAGSHSICLPACFSKES